MASTSQNATIDRLKKLDPKDLPVVRRLARGLSSFTYETIWQGKRHSRKDFPIGSIARQAVFENETKRLFHLDHPNIVKCFGYAIGKNVCSLLQEYVDGDLQTIIHRKIEPRRHGLFATNSPSKVLSNDEINELLRSISPSEDNELEVAHQGSLGLGSNILFCLSKIPKILLPIAIGMKFLHDNGIIHGDLKPNNILVHKRLDIKINDFGLVGTKKQSRLNSKREQHLDMLMWKAPELLDELLRPSTKFSNVSLFDFDIDEEDIEDESKESGSSSDFDMGKLLMADVYSFGLLCSYIVDGELINPNLRLIQFQNKQDFDFNPKLPPTCPELLGSLIHRCLDLDPVKRPTFSIIVADLLAIPNSQACPSDSPNSMKVVDLDKADDLESHDAITLRSRGEIKRRLEDYGGALVDLNKADELEPHNAFTLRCRGDTKRMLKDYGGALVDLNKADELEPHNAFTLRSRGETKRMLEDYGGALVDLNKADELEPYIAFTLRSRGDIKQKLKDYEGALVDLNKVDELEPHNEFTLRSHGDTERILEDCGGALVDLNKVGEWSRIMHSP